MPRSRKGTKAQPSTSNSPAVAKKGGVKRKPGQPSAVQNKRYCTPADATGTTDSTTHGTTQATAAGALSAAGKLIRATSYSVQQRRSNPRNNRGGKQTVPKYYSMQASYLEFLIAGKGYSRGVEFDLGDEVLEPIVKPEYQLLFLDNLARGFQWNRKKWRPKVMTNDEVIACIHDEKKKGWHVVYWSRLLKLRQRYKSSQTSSSVLSSSSSS